MKPNLYYIVHRQFDDVNGDLISNGWKTISVYDIDTQSMSLVEILNTEVGLSTNSLNEVELLMSENEDWDFNSYTFIEL